ncbi:gamma-taxilin-like isoform X2 [Belonocnema kinseyi]|uniref:gamma-taxilin-like isoform X2 n=1 Tax=Belonocnema kinseyi TaxID=2817044 RepID=UPI00143DED02|nr:gamma-taxilin-like isoform X2 [Belonocnema kinseyi]
MSVCPMQCSKKLFKSIYVLIMDNDINESVKIGTSDVEKKTDNVKPESKSHAHQRERKHAREEKSRKKDERGVDQVFKNLGSIDNSDEKLSAMCKKYSDVIDENRKLQLSLKQSEKKVQMIQREKDQLQAERSKAVLTRSRLESLCRELQRQNKAVKEESLLKIREEEEKRKEVSAKFQTTLTEITALMGQNNEKNAKLHEDNMEMSKNFKSVCEQVELREQQFEKIHQQMKLEIQLAEAKLAKVTLEMTADKEVLLNEKKQLLSKLTEYQVRIRDMQTQEVALRSQISMYTDKYDEFQNALTKSNEVFGGFNEEMEKMSKKILKLEKETGLWKQRWEKSHKALYEMAADKQARDAEIEALNRKRLLLLELCKAFQQERTTLIAELKEKTAEVAALNETSVDTKSNEQIEKFTKSSEELGKSLSQAQESLMEDMASQEVKIKSESVKSKDEAPSKPESKKRKDKKRQEVQKGNENTEVKKESSEKAGKDEIALKEKVSEETSSSKSETLNQDKASDKEVIEKENEVKLFTEYMKPVVVEISKEDLSKTEGNSKESDSEKKESNPKENAQEETSVNLDNGEIQVPLQVKVQVPLENKTEVNGEVKMEDGITNEVVHLSEDLKSADLNGTEKENHEKKSISNLNPENGENIPEIGCEVSKKSEIVLDNVEANQIVCEVAVSNQEDVQIKSDSCLATAKKGKVNVF